VRVLQRGGGLDLDFEPISAEDRGQLRLEDFDRDLAVVLQVMGEIHRRHTANAERALDVIAAGEGSRELRSGMHRRVVEPLRYCCVSGCRASPP
jgi:hypothetical protein